MALFPYVRKVWRAGVDDHARCLPARGQHFKELAALIRRHALVGCTMQDQQRRGDAFRMHDGGERQEGAGIFVGLPKRVPGEKVAGSELGVKGEFMDLTWS
jgi:hypothetical protein